MLKLVTAISALAGSATLPTDVNPFNATHAHNSVTSKYCFIDTKRVISMFEDMGFTTQGRKISNSRKYAGYQKHITVMQPVGDIHGDSIPAIFIKNCHKSGAMVISLGYFRMCCENQLPFAIEGFTFTFRHIGDQQEMYDKILTVIGMIRHKIEELKSLRDQLIAIKPSQAMKTALIDTLNAQRPTSAKVKESDVLAARRDADTEDNLWVLLNKVQEMGIRGGFGVRALRSETRMFDVSSALVQTAMKLAA